MWSTVSLMHMYQFLYTCIMCIIFGAHVSVLIYMYKLWYTRILCTSFDTHVSILIHLCNVYHFWYKCISVDMWCISVDTHISFIMLIPMYLPDASDVSRFSILSVFVSQTTATVDGDTKLTYVQKGDVDSTLVRTLEDENTMVMVGL